MLSKDLKRDWLGGVGWSHPCLEVNFLLIEKRTAQGARRHGRTRVKHAILKRPKIPGYPSLRSPCFNLLEVKGLISLYYVDYLVQTGRFRHSFPDYREEIYLIRTKVLEVLSLANIERR